MHVLEHQRYSGAGVPVHPESLPGPLPAVQKRQAGQWKSGKSNIIWKLDVYLRKPIDVFKTENSTEPIRYFSLSVLRNYNKRTCRFNVTGVIAVENSVLHRLFLMGFILFGMCLEDGFRRA